MNYDMRTKEAYWVERIRLTLNSRKNSNSDPNRAYVQVDCKYLIGLMLCVFVKAPHQGRVKCVHTDSVGVGVMGMMGNKNGVSLRLQYYDSTLCFVNTHLAAHRVYDFFFLQVLIVQPAESADDCEIGKALRYESSDGGQSG